MQDTTLVISDVEQSVTLVISDVVSLNDYIPKSIINAKGDLIVGGENGEPIRFPTGETNQFLVVDPIENSGYKFTNLFNDLGDIIFGGAGGETVILPGNNTTTKKFLSQTGTGVNSDAVIWDRIAVDDVPILNQNTTGIASAAAILINPRSINGVNFDGSADITINAIDSTPRIALSEKGVANGVATLGVDGLIPTTQLPSYIDDVLEFNNLSMFPVIGEIGKIYVALDTNKVYRWSGSVYIFITSGAVDSVAGKTGVVALNKNDVGLGSVDNTSDLSKPISTATQTALDNKANIFSPVFLGNVGIGTTNPSSRLTVWGSGTGATNLANFVNSASTSVMTILNNGNVGIGTTAPSTQLEVSSADTSNSFVTVSSQLGLVDRIKFGYTLSGSVNDDNPAKVMVTSGGDLNIASRKDSASYINFFTSEGASLVERMRINTAGNVGIGTINPTATVHLKAGTATAGTAPLKFISGTLLTSPEVGVFEYNNTLHFTNSDAVRRNVVVSDQSYTAGAVAVGGRVRMRIGGTEYNVLVE